MRFISLPDHRPRAVAHSPDHQLLLALDLELALDAVYGIAYSHRLVAPGLSDLSVRQAPRKQREYLRLPREVTSIGV